MWSATDNLAQETFTIYAPSLKTAVDVFKAHYLGYAPKVKTDLINGKIKLIDTKYGYGVIGELAL